jgi:LacI family transcriptional regulator/LacI family repressor for deo operon, udp, cdd, tsx, nupC, and nupG
MTRRAISIQDIAERAGVSHSTVSRALHDSPLISPEMRQRLQSLAAEMGYMPNAVAQSLRGKRTNTIGLVISSIADPFVGRVVRGVEDVAHSANLSVFLSVSHDDPEREIKIFETFRRRRVDGVISVTAQISGSYVQQLAQINMPTVMINQQADSEADRFHSVDADDYGGARLAVEHLLGLGHRAIGYIGVCDRVQSNRRRLTGYRHALAAARITANDNWVHISQARRAQADDAAGGQALLPDLLAAGVTAIFCYNDLVAVGVLMACRELGIAVPEQLSVIGYDDVEVASYVTPPLTTIHQPKLRMGEIAMQMLLDILDGRPVQDQFLPVDLVVRGSTGMANFVLDKPDGL